MASPEVVADMGATLVKLLQQGLSGVVSPTDIFLSTPDEMKTLQPLVPTVTVFLYHVSLNAELRNALPPSGKGGRPQLPLELHYLLTPWAKEISDTHKIVGYMLGTLYQKSTLVRAELQGSSWASDDTAQLLLESLPIEDHYSIWEPTEIPYRLSLSYLVRVMSLEAGPASAAPPVVSAVFGGQAP
jgi:hypothetical protein